MDAWCSIDDVDERVQGNPSESLCREFAAAATSLLFDLSGRRFAGKRDVTTEITSSRRGIASLSMWAPVNSVSSVKVDGTEIKSSCRLSPAGTYLTVPASLGLRVLAVKLSTGQEPPTSGRFAAAALAADMIRGDLRYADPDDESITDRRRDPQLTSVSRQGVTYSYQDLAALAEKNQTGIYEVDLFLRAVNPNGTRHQPKVVTV